ncbi:MAG: hypothetical protein ACRCX2_29565 [Paraclostridium sp.]
MKSLDTSHFLTGIGEVINCNDNFFQPLITPLVSIDSVCNQNYFDDMLVNLKTQIIDHQTKVISNILGNNDNLIKPINLNFLDSDIKLINFDIFNNLSDINYGFKPLSIPNNDYTFSTNKKDSNILNLSSDLINYSRISITNQLTTSIPDSSINLSNSNLISNTFFNSSCYSFQTDNFSLQNSFKPITLIDINQNLFSTFKQPSSYSPLNYNYLEQNSYIGGQSYISFNPFLYPEINHNRTIITNKEIVRQLNSIRINISSSKQDIKIILKGSTCHFYEDNNPLAINIDIEPSELDINTYNASIIKRNYKHNQGKGGRKKRETERLFFISKFNELRELDRKSKDKNILHKIWIEHSYKELSALSKTRGITTLTEWYRKYIAKSA